MPRHVRKMSAGAVGDLAVSIRRYAQLEAKLRATQNVFARQIAVELPEGTGSNMLVDLGLI